MTSNIYNEGLNFGSVYDSLDKLKNICENNAMIICNSIEIKENDTIEIPFWTSDIPELICIGKFYKNKDGEIKYELDYTESTL